MLTGRVGARVKNRGGSMGIITIEKYEQKIKSRLEIGTADPGKNMSAAMIRKLLQIAEPS